MGKRTRFGTCRLCLEDGPLTFEHVPPASAFNNRPVYLKRFEDMIQNGQIRDDGRKGKTQQRGSGQYSLCDKCNSRTGAWYGPAYMDWAYQGLRHCHHSLAAPSLSFNFNIFPLRVIKQVVCMLLSINTPSFMKRNAEIRAFVLDRERRFLPPEIKIYAYHTRSRKIRMTGYAVAADFSSSEFNAYGEIAFYPWGYLFCFDGARKVDRRLVDITSFSRYQYNDWKELTFRAPVLPISTMYPADYRSDEEVERAVLRSKRAYQKRKDEKS